MIEVKRYDEYIQTNKRLKKKNSKRFKRYVYSLGYIDGLYGEKEYVRYIPDDEECINLYAEGYKEGKTDEINNSSKTSFTKSVWISKLAVLDYKNKFRDRHLTEEAEELYNLNYDDLMGLGYEDTIDDELVAKLEEEGTKVSLSQK